VQARSEESGMSGRECVSPHSVSRYAVTDVTPHILQHEGVLRDAGIDIGQKISFYGNYRSRARRKRTKVDLFGDTLSETTTYELLCLRDNSGVMQQVMSHG
jgi:hypothetical protein